MLGVQLGALGSTPDGVDAALGVVGSFDEALVHGFARLGEERAAAVLALAGAVGGTPLGERAREAAEKVVAGSVTDEHLAVLAGARSAVFGAVHDALLDQLDTALDRPRTPWPPTTPAGTGEAPGGARVPGGARAADGSAGVARVAGGARAADGPAGVPRVAGGARAADGSAGVPRVAGGARVWLRELAIAGWRGVDHDLVGAADQAIEALLGDPGSRRLAVLLDGLAAELRASSPVATMDQIPARRWADLWARATLLTHNGPPETSTPETGAAQSGTGEGGAGHLGVAKPGAPETSAPETGAAHPGAVRDGGPRGGGVEWVSGRVLVLGVDLHEHGTAVQVEVHGILEPSGRLVRASVAAAKVDTIAGPAVWSLFADHPVLLAALAKQLAIDITDMPVIDGADLVWDDARAKAAEAANPFTTARVRLSGATAPAVPSLDRHPVRICEPVLVEGYQVKDGTLHLDGESLMLDLDRLPTAGPLTPKLVASSTACIGLLRWDAGQWMLQPLAVQGKTKAAHSGDLALTPGKSDAVAVLKERAGRLLRK